jgi:hypothetical protein
MYGMILILLLSMKVKKKKNLKINFHIGSRNRMWNVSPIPFNPFEYDDIARQKYKWLYEINPESQMFRWICRNQIMVQRIKNTIKAHEGKRILCMAGADHNYCYYDGLKELNVELVYTLK